MRKRKMIKVWTGAYPCLLSARRCLYVVKWQCGSRTNPIAKKFT